MITGSQVPLRQKVHAAGVSLGGSKDAGRSMVKVSFSPNAKILAQGGATVEGLFRRWLVGLESDEAALPRDCR